MTSPATVGRVEAGGVIHDVIYRGDYVILCTRRRAPKLLRDANTPVTCFACLLNEG